MKMERKREQKRAAILESAIGTFRADGYIGASMDDIARKAGVTKQTVYRYFESKEALYQAALEAQRDKSHSRFINELDREDTREALLHFARGFVGKHLSNEHLATMRLLMAEGPEAPEVTRAHFALGPRETREHLARFLVERFGMEDPEYAIKVLLSTLLSMTTEVLIGRCASPTQEEMDLHAEKTVGIFMKLLP